MVPSSPRVGANGGGWYYTGPSRSSIESVGRASVTGTGPSGFSAFPGAGTRCLDAERMQCGRGYGGGWLGQDSQMTTADATPASWESDTWIVPTPSSSARSATVPRTSNDGLPESSVTTSASCQESPAGAPSALASASLAANRAASDCGERSSPEWVTRS